MQLHIGGHPAMCELGKRKRPRGGVACGSIEGNPPWVCSAELDFLSPRSGAFFGAQGIHDGEHSMVILPERFLCGQRAGLLLLHHLPRLAGLFQMGCRMPGVCPLRRGSVEPLARREKCHERADEDQRE
ncbi:MAG: hypothetical protein NTV08_12965 [Verrucomicrobia bacterium]|nr:hypothetical protein [Verrucomicrobiota bacterium]